MILALAIMVMAGPAQSTSWAKGGSVESPCKKLIGAVRYKKDAMGLAQMDGVAQGAFLTGEHWAKATDEQKKEFVSLFHKMFAGIAFPRIRSSFENLETIIYDKPVVKKDTARVGSTIVILHPMKKQEIVATWDLSKHADGWKVTDVTVKGDRSMLTTIRDDQVLPLLGKKGWDGVLEAMRKRVAKLK